VPAATAINTDYDIRVAEDQLTATVRVDPGSSINASQLIAQLTRAGIQFIDEAAILTAAKQPPAEPEGEKPAESRTIVVARGQPAVEDVPEKLVKIESHAAAEPPPSHYERVQIDTVNAGDVIAEIVPAVVGRDGIDVFGRPIKRRRPAQPIAPEEGAERIGDHMKATRAGRCRIDGNRIRVEPRLDIPGDVNFGTGNIRFDGDVNVRGSVLDLFLVGSTADIHVSGAVEAAQVHAGADITIGGGITGKDKGQVTAGGSIKCRYISNGHVCAGGNLKVSGEIANSRVITGGRVIAESGTILGSHITANGGVCCRTLGSPAFVKTTVEVGLDLALREFAANLLPELNRCMSNAQHMRDVIQPLLRDRKRLSAAERDKATELLYSAARTDQELAAKLAEFRAAFERSAAKCKAEVHVSDMLYSGVTVRLPGMSAIVSQTFRGPLLIAAAADRKRQITITSDDGGQVVTLVTTRVADEGGEALDSILQLAA
jgi:uncharacterized protein (DUF342 family)